jgi:hypothetical protein
MVGLVKETVVVLVAKIPIEDSALAARLVKVAS